MNLGSGVGAGSQGQGKGTECNNILWLLMQLQCFTVWEYNLQMLSGFLEEAFDLHFQAGKIGQIGCIILGKFLNQQLFRNMWYTVDF